MDHTLQKAVELGVTAIQPIAAKRSVVKLAGERADRRVTHWQGVVASACEQCRAQPGAHRGHAADTGRPGSVSMVPGGYCFCRHWPKPTGRPARPHPDGLPGGGTEGGIEPAPFRSPWDRTCCALKATALAALAAMQTLSVISRACCNRPPSGAGTRPCLFLRLYRHTT